MERQYFDLEKATGCKTVASMCRALCKQRVPIRFQVIDSITVGKLDCQYKGRAFVAYGTAKCMEDDLDSEMYGAGLAIRRIASKLMSIIQGWPLTMRQQGLASFSLRGQELASAMECVRATDKTNRHMQRLFDRMDGMLVGSMPYIMGDGPTITVHVCSPLECAEDTDLDANAAPEPCQMPVPDEPAVFYSEQGNGTPMPDNVPENEPEFVARDDQDEPPPSEFAEGVPSEFAEGVPQDWAQDEYPV